MKKELIKTNEYLLVVEKEHLVDMPSNLNVYSMRYRNVIRFSEVENSYLNECFEILFHLPLNNSPILEGVPLLPPLEEGVFTFPTHFDFEIEVIGITDDGMNKIEEPQTTTNSQGQVVACGKYLFEL